MNTNNLTPIAIDAMGGDFGCSPIISGVIEALKKVKFKAFLVGDISQIQPLIPEKFLNFVEFVDTKDVFNMDESATDVLKRKESSIFKAVELVRQGICKAVVSAGHSGATMSLATLRIGRLANVARPAIATLMPNINGSRTLVLDVGANVDCKPEHLFEFGVMGESYAKEILKRPQAKIGLLSNGEEDCKGNEVTKEAFLMLKNLDSFVGNVEGGQIFDGSVDVVICDGFVGNVLLKTSEGVATAVTKILKNRIKKSLVSMFGATFMIPAFKELKKNVDYDEYGGAPLLGVKGCTIISHGKSSPKAIKNAVFQALKFADSSVNAIIENRLKQFKVQK